MEFFIENSWKEIIEKESKKKYFQTLMKKLEEDAGQFYPEQADIFNAFKMTPLEKIKVVIVGQDPYHGEKEAMGLCFSVKDEIKTPPSLKNIFKELKDDLGVVPKTTNLEAWAKRGVFLLNATLTVKKNKPLSHHGIGWEEFTDKVIEVIAKKKQSVVFLLWGKKAEEKCQRVLSKIKHSHLVLKAAHPSPFSVKKFLGCKHFSKANEFLENGGREKVDWSL